MLLDDDSAGVVLQVEQVPRILGHLSSAGAVVLASGVTHGLKVLLPLRLILILNWEECDRRVDEAVLTQQCESHMRHLLNIIVYLIADDGSLHTVLWGRGVSPPGPHMQSGRGPIGSHKIHIFTTKIPTFHSRYRRYVLITNELHKFC
jgi:hypothetical protein